MAIRRLYLAHHHAAAREVHVLAQELRLHGIAPWVDKEGGFKIGDHSPDEARRAIREDCFGLLLYATEPAFHSDFIREVEIDEARSRREQDNEFLLFGVPRRISFDDLKQLSLSKFGYDLSAFHAVAIPEGADLDAAFRDVANAVVERLLSRAAGESTISLQFSTRELLPDAPDDRLCINAVPLLAAAPDWPRTWNRLLVALRHLKARIAQALGRPRLLVHGSKHLSAAFMFGRVLAPFEMDIRQTPNDVWKTDAKSAHGDPLRVSVVEGPENSRDLFLEVTSRYKDVAAGVDAFLEMDRAEPTLCLQLRPPRDEILDLDNGLCLSMVNQTYAELERILRGRQIERIHIFAAAPQAFMMMLGRAFKGMPPVYLYEWAGERYVFACSIPGGVL